MSIDHLARAACLASAALLLSSAAFAQAAVEPGRKVFAGQKCSICHAVAGVGNAKGALDGVGARLSAADIRQWIIAAPEMAAKVDAKRKPAMKAYPDLPKGDLEALVSYLLTLTTT